MKVVELQVQQPLAQPHTGCWVTLEMIEGKGESRQRSAQPHTLARVLKRVSLWLDMEAGWLH